MGLCLNNCKPHWRTPLSAVCVTRCTFKKIYGQDHLASRPWAMHHYREYKRLYFSGFTWRKGTVWMFFLPTAFARCHKSLIFLLQVCGIWPGSSFQTCVCFWSVCNSCWLLPICISWQKYVHRREKHKHVIHKSFLYLGNWGLETVVSSV